MPRREGYASFGDITITAGGDPRVRVEITPGSNEIIDFVEVYTDNNQQPGDFMGQLWYVEGAQPEIWEAYEWDLQPDIESDGYYHILCWVSTWGFNSERAQEE